MTQRDLGKAFGNSVVLVANLPPEKLELPNVTVTLAANAGSVNAGEQVHFTVTVANTGHGTSAAGLTLDLPLPAPGGNAAWQLDGTAPSSDSFQLVTMNGNQFLQYNPTVSSLFGNNTQYVGLVTTTVPGPTPFLAPLTLLATVDSPDETVRDQSSTATVNVLSPDVTATVSADAPQLIIGANAGFTIQLSNVGMGLATGLSLQDALPALGGGQLWSIDPASPNASAFAVTGVAGSQMLSLNSVNSLAAGGSLLVHLTGITAALGTLSNAASVSAGNEIAALQNQTATASILVVGPPTTLTSIARQGGAVVNPGLNPVSWTVSFADPVSGLGAGNFTLVASALGGSPTIVAVTPVGAAPSLTWTVSASTGTGDGSLQLDLTSDAGLNHTVSNLPGIGDIIRFNRTPPTAVDDQYVMAFNHSLVTPAVSGVLANDIVGHAGDSLIASLVANPAQGSVTLNSDGSFTYWPASGFIGVDTFTYQDADTTNGTTSNIATVSINVIDAVAPSVISPTNAFISNVMARLGGTIPADGDGGAPVTKRGVLYALTAINAHPQLGGVGVIEVDASMAGAGVFSQSVGGLNPSTSYSYVAFATNLAGTGYTNAVAFTTLASSASSITGPATGQAAQKLTFTLNAYEPTASLQAYYHTFQIKWGDGKTDSVVGLNGMTFDHTYASPGVYTVQVSAIDARGNVLPTGTLSITITSASPSSLAHPKSPATIDQLFATDIQEWLFVLGAKRDG